MHDLTLPPGTELTWTLLGRIPLAIVLVVLTLHARRGMGTLRALLGLSAFCSGAMLGTALLPSIVGALAGGTLAVLVAWKYLHAPWPAPAPFAIGWLALLGIGRLGCFLAGCCFGRPFEGRWAVHYGVGSFAQHLHRELGLVGADERSLGVHPVQLYECVAVLAWLAASPWFRRRLRSDGAWALLSVSIYLLIRVVLDPMRAMVNTVSSLRRFGPLSAFQWGCLLTAVATAFVARAWWQRDRMGTRAPRPLPRSSSASELVARALRAVVVQFAFAFAALPESTPILRYCTGLSLLLSAAAVASQRVALGVNERRWAITALAGLLLVPLRLYAADGAGGEGQPRWLYTAVPSTQQLVRIGTTETPPGELVREYAELEPSPAPVNSVSPEGAPPPVIPPPELTPPVPPAERARPEPSAGPSEPSSRNLEVGALLLGGRQNYQSPGCSGTTGYQSFVRSGVLVGSEIQPGTFWQARLTGIFQPSSSSSLPPSSGAFVSGSGFYETNWKYVGLGGGLALGGGNLGTDFNLYYPSSSGPGFRLQVMPLVYARFGSPTLAAFEMGTGSRFQPEEGPFLDVRFGSDAPGDFAFRVGAESVWLPYPLANAVLFGSITAPVTSADRLELRLEYGSGNDEGPSVTGGLRFAHRFEY